MLKHLIRWFGSLQTTTKFGVSFSLMLAIIVMEMFIGYAALTVVWESNNAIQHSAEIQRLTMTMGRNWEAARRLQKEFFLQSSMIGADEAYRVQAMASAGKIAEVIRDGATLKRLIATSDARSAVYGQSSELNLILATVSHFATTYDEAAKLELQLASQDSGLQTQRESASEQLSALLNSASEGKDLSALYYEIRFFGEAGRPNLGLVTVASSRLREAIEQSSLPPDAMDAAFTTLAEYMQLTGAIAQTDAQIQERLALLSQLGESIEPSLLELMASVNMEAGQARLQIAQTRQTAVNMLVAAVVIGLLLALAVAGLLHFTVTRQVTRLTGVASRLQAGDLDARSLLDRNDELGRLAATLNAMAAKLGLTMERMEIVRKASLDLTSQLDADTVMEQALTVAASLSGAEVGFIGLAKGNDLFLAKTIGALSDVHIGERLPYGEGALDAILRARYTNDALTPRPTAGADGLFPANYTCVVIPLLSAHRALGILALAASRTEAFAPDLLRFLELYATGAAVAIHNAMLYKDARQLAVVDTLTGLYNRRGLVQCSHDSISQALQHRSSVAVIFLDIDNFKAFNDRYSYDTGDQILLNIASCLRQSVRDRGPICRYGGEEFVIMLPGMDGTEAAALAEQLRRTIATDQIPTRQGALAVTISLGVAAGRPDCGLSASDNGHGEDVLDDLIARAGQMLHVAKQSGRNRVVAEHALVHNSTRR